MSAAERLAELAEERNALRLVERKVRLVASNLRRQLDALPRPRTVTDREFYDELRSTVEGLEGEGLPRRMGTSFDDVVSLVGKPGLAPLERRRAELDAEEVELNVRVARWPTPDTTHPYRYVGPQDAHFQDDRYIDVGEVMALTEDQSIAWRDRFEPADAPVASEEPVTAS